MRLKISYKTCLVFSTIISCFLTSSIRGQTIEETRILSDNSYISGNYNKAFILYKRLLFFDDSANKAIYYRKLALCAEKIKDFKSATYYYSQLKYIATTDSIYSKSILKEWATGLLADPTPDLIKSFYNIDTSIFTYEQKLQLLFYYALTCLKLNAIDSATNAFKTLSCFVSTEDSISLQELIVAYRKDMLIDPNRISRMSLYLPGLGQLKLHKYKYAANSFLLNTALVSGLVFTSLQYTLLEGVLFWGPSVGHYYIGGANATYELTEKRIAELTPIYYNKFIKLITPMHFAKCSSF